MEITIAVQASTLLEAFDETSEILNCIKNQKENISGELVLNCTDFNKIHLDSVKIDEDDAKRILQFIEDYFSEKIDNILGKIERLD